MIATSRVKAVIGTGITGLSVARYFTQIQQPFILLDTRETLPHAEQLRQEFPEVTVECGPLHLDTLLLCDEIILSPGVAQSTPAIADAKAAGVSVIGDIELFARAARAPIVAITGSNAKSTVTTLVGEMAATAGLRVAVGGNLGTPALALLNDDVELYVLELSSFQLETVSKLNAKVATILNISADHLDRYDSMNDYVLAKLRVYFGADTCVMNKGDVLTHPPLGLGVKPVYFGGKADFGGFGVLERDGITYLAKNLTPLLDVKELLIRGRHNVDNALAALALGDAAGIPMDAMLTTLRVFRGLSHRCEFVAEVNGVEYFDDSKGTNIGATVAAITGLARDPQKLVLILGGEGKGQDFNELVPTLLLTSCDIILIGRDAPLIEHALNGQRPCFHAHSMTEAVSLAASRAQVGDAVLLSPACASFDMFKSYADRGQQFAAAVKVLQPS